MCLMTNSFVELTDASRVFKNVELLCATYV